MPTTHILHLPSAGRETVLAGLSPQSRLVLDFPARGVFVGRENNDLVFSRIDGTCSCSRTIMRPEHAPRMYRRMLQRTARRATKARPPLWWVAGK